MPRHYTASKFIAIILFVSLLLITISYLASALPAGPGVIIIGNSTKGTAGATKINSSVNGSTPGGFIFTAVLDSRQQNIRWKAYVGNVTGTLALDDANDNTIYQWSLTAVSGEVYSTRSSGTINWTGINCTWIYEGSRNATMSNRSAEEFENTALSHTNKDDNITATFARTNHSAISIGVITIGKNECFSVQTFQKDAAQVFSDSNNANFTEVILYDGAFNKSSGSIVYETKIEQNIPGYNANELYDFQMIVPENGAQGFVSSTAYYFYVELN